MKKRKPNTPLSFHAMPLSDPDPTFAAQVDAYISDDSDRVSPSAVPPLVSFDQTHPVSSSALPPLPDSPSNPRDSFHINRQRLNRFHHEAKSFISANLAAAPAPAPNSADADAQHIHVDTQRLARFHAQAVSFLDRAYANEPSTLITEESLSPAGLAAAHSRIAQREMLERFHTEAIHFLDTAAAASAPTHPTDPIPPPADPASAPDSTSMRIARDKARLEQNYRDAMSFLNRSDTDRRLVEEQELETAAVERIQLQKYAREAMSFLDKAFSGDASVLVRDDYDDPFNPRVSSDAATSGNFDEASQIAADRAALERYEEEFGDFLSKAYEDDTTVIVDDADSETSGTERELYARRMAGSTPSVGSDSGYEEQLSDEAYTDDEYQDRTVADQSHLDALQRALPVTSNTAASTSNSSPHVRDPWTDDHMPPRNIQQADDSLDSENVHSRMVQYEREAADYLDGANVSDEEMEEEVQDETVVDDASVSSPEHVVHDKRINFDSSDDHAIDSRALRGRRPPSPEKLGLRRSAERRQSVDRFPVSKDSRFSSDVGIDEERNLKPSEMNFGFRDNAHRESSPRSEFLTPHGDFMSPRAGFVSPRAEFVSPRGEFFSSSSRAPERREGPSPFPSTDAGNRDARPDNSIDTPSSPENLKMDVTLEHESGQKQWSSMAIERSFYRQIPRGATIKLRPRVSQQISTSSRTGTSASNEMISGAGSGVSPEELRRVEKERDVLMATLEEIVNERSQLAAQVSEMKSMIRAVGEKGGDGPKEQVSSKTQETDDWTDIDLAVELKEAHAVMSKMTEEMDETLSVLDGRYQETLQRAHAAEEQCTRLASNASRLETQFTAQGSRLSAALSEERRLSSLLSRTEKEFEELRLKSEGDIQKIEDEYREEAERKMRKVRELTTEVSLLQEKLREGGTVEERQAMLTDSKRLEMESKDLRERVRDLEGQLTRERDAARKRREKDRENIEKEANEKVEKMSTKLRVAERQLGELGTLREEIRNVKSEKTQALERAEKAERARVEAESSINLARKGQKAAELEANEIRARFEESLKQRISQLDQTSDLVELQGALQSLRESASERESSLQKQLDEFRVRAEQAEKAAASAEKGAKEAAEMAKLVQQRSKTALESERLARQAAESDREALAVEWEKFSKKQEEKAKEESSGLGKSSSRRGLRKSPSKSSKDEKRKKKESRASASEEGGKKKSSHRSRLFG